MAREKDFSENTSGRNSNGTFAEGNEFGRPAFYDNPEDLEQKVVDYFEWIQGEFTIETKITTKTTGKGDKAVTTTEHTPIQIWTRYPEQPSITGLAIYLGFESRQSLYDYIKKEPFSYSIKKGLLKVENNYEKGLWSDKPVGPMFGLKNMGWSDKNETKLTGDAENPLQQRISVEVKNSGAFIANSEIDVDTSREI